MTVQQYSWTYQRNYSKTFLQIKQLTALSNDYRFFLKLKLCSFRSSIDATNEPSSLAAYINDSPACYSNAVMNRVVLKNKVHLCLFCTTFIKSGTGIRYLWKYYLYNFSVMFFSYKWPCLNYSWPIKVRPWKTDFLLYVNVLIWNH